MPVLMHELGFRAPYPAEEARLLARAMHMPPSFPRLRRAGGARPLAGIAEGGAAPAGGPASAALIPAAVLHGDPLISYSSVVDGAPLGLASVAGQRLRGRPAWFLISPTWSIETGRIAEDLHEAAILHRAPNPDHRLIFVCNSPEEVATLREVGEAAFFCNKTAHVQERIFKPLRGVRAEFDAIYNAQLVPWKRHELSLEIERCAFLFYRDALDPDAAAAEAAILVRHAAAAPGHVFINRFDRGGVPIRLSPHKVNRHLNRASVGLCLSAEEGAMFASTEYLLAGLPVVSTPSVGGRHVYYDEEYCRIVPPDPRSVAEAVRALKAKGIPRAHIRERTLRRLQEDRARFLELLNAILDEGGSDKRLSMPWPFRKAVTMQWLPSNEAVSRAIHGIVDGFEREKEGIPPWRKWWRALRARWR